MSAFLGPIHMWLFRKIQFQNALVDAIIEHVTEDGISNELRTSIDQTYGTLEQGELQNIIDENNIHGWLQERISLVENRLAYVITTLTRDHPEQMMEISDVVYQFGKDHEASQGMTVHDAYEYLENLLLNGMPCDRVNQILEETEEQLRWKETTDIHQSYWTKIGGNPEYYYAVRESLVIGILENSNINFEVLDNYEFLLCKES